MRAAFYKGTHAGLPGLYNRLVRRWCRSAYSHVELVFADGQAASSSYMDGGVRFKAIDFDPALWDFVALSPVLEQRARAWFAQHQGQPYDLLGNLHFVVGAIGDAKDKWFCSESVAAALGLDQPWRYDPATLYSALAFWAVAGVATGSAAAAAA